jgi:hypothetical protein
VDAFIYSDLLAGSPWQGESFDHLMHVTDWFPTILDMAGVRIDRGSSGSTSASASDSSDSSGSSGSTMSSFVYSPASMSADGTKSLAYDGVSQWATLSGSNPAGTSPARTKMVYNSFVGIADAFRDIWTNGTFAIRNDRYDTTLINFSQQPSSSSSSASLSLPSHFSPTGSSFYPPFIYPPRAQTGTN